MQFTFVARSNRIGHIALGLIALPDEKDHLS
jgi:hypothetical protein